jgi:hypothetical protein
MPSNKSDNAKSKTPANGDKPKARRAAKGKAPGKARQTRQNSAPTRQDEGKMQAQTYLEISDWGKKEVANTLALSRVFAERGKVKAQHRDLFSLAFVTHAAFSRAVGIALMTRRTKAHRDRAHFLFLYCERFLGPAVDHFRKVDLDYLTMFRWPRSPVVKFGCVSGRSALHVMIEFVGRTWAIINARKHWLPRDSRKLESVPTDNETVGRFIDSAVDRLSEAMPQTSIWPDQANLDSDYEAIGFQYEFEAEQMFGESWPYIVRQDPAGTDTAEYKWTPQSLRNFLKNWSVEILSKVRLASLKESMGKAARDGKIKLPPTLRPVALGGTPYYHPEELCRLWPEFQKTLPYLPNLKKSPTAPDQRAKPPQTA